MSQPRKIAAITIAQRVAEERNTTIGGEIGYQVGLHKMSNMEGMESGTDILYCTTGVILQKLVHEKSLDCYTHIILDEVHERDIDIDFLLVIVRSMIARKSSNTKIVLMSATMDVGKFRDYFKITTGDGPLCPPLIDLSRVDRKYNLNYFYLEDFSHMHDFDVESLVDYTAPGISDNLYAAACNIVLIFLTQAETKKEIKAPAILVFLPGLYEIERFHEQLVTESAQNFFKKNQMKPDICILHSSLSTDEQRHAFYVTSNPKIILSTNIAESSVTIRNITHVLDFCLTKYQSSARGTQGLTSLILDWTSKNNCEQRAGRAGRVCEGGVIRLVSKDFYMHQMNDYPAPEILRSSLKEVVIKIKLLNIYSPLEMLAYSLDPPDKSSVIDAVLHLKELGGLHLTGDKGFDYEDGDITFVGRIMAKLPVDTAVTKFIIIGYLFGVLDEAIIIGAGLTVKNIFTQEYGKKIGSYLKKISFAHGSRSDCLAILNAFRLWSTHKEQGQFQNAGTEKTWCNNHSLDVKNLREMEQLVNDVTGRLEGLGIRKLTEGQKTWELEEKYFILKLCMAGAFGPANFFRPEDNSESERELSNSIYGMDLNRTVFFKNMDRSVGIVGEIYEKQIHNELRKNGVTDRNSKVTCHFSDCFSEKIIVAFKETEESEEQFDEESPLFGKIIPEVYKAVKMRQMGQHVNLNTMNREDSFAYAETHGLGMFDSDADVFVKHENVVKNPGLIVEPTICTKQMEGFITHVQHCNKFFFRPSLAIGSQASLVDNRYDISFKEILQIMDSSEIVPFTSSQGRVGKFVIMKSGKKLFRGILKSQQDLKNTINVEIMDVSNATRAVDIKTVFTLKDKNVEEKLLSYPPRVFECTLKEIQPSLFSPQNGMWSPHATQLFRENVLSKFATIEIYSVVNGVASVTLQVLGVDWNSKLLKEKFAQKCEESYLSKIDHEHRRSRQLENHFIPPEESFKNKINNDKEQSIIPSPPLSKCTHLVKLKGPFSPLEITLQGISRMISTSVNVEPSSVNSVLLNDEIQSPRGKFCVAAEMTVNPKGKHITIRQTTMMPNIPGLDVILALIFAPTAELRRDKTKSKFISVLTGLGYDENLKRPYYAERDASLLIDVCLTEEDLDRINHLRYCMSHLLILDGNSETPDLVDGEKVNTMEMIKLLILEILNEDREVIDVTHPDNQMLWGIDQAGTTKRTHPYSSKVMFGFLGVPMLAKKSHSVRKDFIDHSKDLFRCSEGLINLPKKICRFCNFEWKTNEELSLHLLSKKHNTLVAMKAI